MSKFIGIIVGAFEIVAGVVIGVLSGGSLAFVSALLIKVGVGTLIAGAGTLLTSALSSSGSALTNAGYSAATRNPISPWNVIYGRSVVGGTIVYLHEWGTENKYFDIVIVLACHPCQAVDGLLFNNQPVQLSTDNGTFNGVRGDSFTPLQQTVSLQTISRTEGVVTVVLKKAIPLLKIGDRVLVEGITGDRTLNGTVYAQSVNTTLVSGGDGSTTFTYISGGLNSVVDLEGHVKTTWPDYGRKIHMEVLLGNHTTTFPGMISGTSNDGSTTDLIYYPDGQDNPWTADCRLLGRTSVFLRLHYNDTYFSQGLPQINFLVRGKNDILDPRTSATGYTENAALCIADYLSNVPFGFKAAYTTEIPTTPLIAAANTCDESVPLAAGGTEPRYALNGKFDLSVNRGEVLQNMLTSCAGRLTYQGGQFFIHPAAWMGSSPAPAPSIGAMPAPYRWRPTTSVRALFNGVKGTYVSPANNWQASDIPPYAQDVKHGYSSDANLAADNGERRWLDIQLPFTISPSASQRICKIELLRRRYAGTGTFAFNLSGYTMQTLDVISMTLSYLNWTGKLLEITAHRFTIAEQRNGATPAVLLGTEIDVQETDASIYDWSPTEELTAEGFRQPTLPNAFTPAPPTGVVLLSDYSTVIRASGAFRDSILVQWDKPADGYVTNGGHIELQYQLASTPVTTGTVSIDTNGNMTFSSTVLAAQMIGAILTIGSQSFMVASVLTTTTGTASPSPSAAITASPFMLTPQGQIWTGLPSVNGSTTQLTISPVVDGLQYIAQLRSVNAGGTPSAWVSAGPVTASGAGGPDAWNPSWEQGLLANDPIYGSRYSFGTSVDYQSDNGVKSAILNVRGYQPVNVTSALIGPPSVPLVADVIPSGGSIPIGEYEIVLTAEDSRSPVARETGRSSTIRASVTVANSRIAIRGIIFDPSTSAYNVYIGANRNLFAKDNAGLLVGGTTGGDVGSTPGLIVISELPPLGYGFPPDQEFDHFEIQSTEETGGYLWVLQVTDINSDGTVLTFAGETMATDEFKDCVLSLAGQGATGKTTWQPIVNLPITTNSADAVAVGTSITGMIFVGDYVVCRMKLTVTGGSDGLTFGDSKLTNSVNTRHEVSTMNTNQHYGEYAYVVGGSGKSQFRTITGNDGTTFRINEAFSPRLDQSSIVVTLSSSFFFDVGGPGVVNDGYHPSPTFAPVVGFSQVKNYSGKLIFTRVISETREGLASDGAYAPFRETFIAGQAGSTLAASDGYAYPAIDSTTHKVTIDLAAGLNQKLVLSPSTASGSPLATDAVILQPINSAKTIADGDSFYLYIVQDSTGGWAAPTFTLNAAAVTGPPAVAAVVGGFASDVIDRATAIDGRPGIATLISFTRHPGNVWAMDYITPGVSLS